MKLTKKLRRLFKGKKTRSGKSGSPRRMPVLESNGGPRAKGGGPSSRSKARYPHYRKRRHSWFRRFLKKSLLWGSGAAVAGYLWFSWGLPDIEELNTFTKAPSILIKSEDGQIIGSFGHIYGDFVRYEDLPVSLIDAVLATEDRNFYHHFGVDPLGLARAMYVNIKARRVVQGGSTITQQVAKNVFLTPERTITRKIQEALLAFRLERRFTKQEILSIYMNRVYLGAGNYGVEAASRRYFDKPAREMTLSDSAIIAGLLKAPSRFAPTSNPTLSRKRAEQVLINMADAEYLTKEQADKAIKELGDSMQKRARYAQSTYYFADWILDQLPEYMGNVQQDLVVVTTLRPDLQVMAEKAITDVMDKDGAPHHASQAALVAMSPDGAIRVMVGGRNYGESQYNRATQSLRQPGSAFKLFVYLAGLESGLTPESPVEDKPITIGKWQPKNYTGKYLGTVSLREAVQDSINTVSVQVSQYAGLNRVVGMARRLGVTSDIDPLPSIALGSTEVSLLEMTNAYAHLAANGRIVYPYGIIEIDTVDGKVLYKRTSAVNGAALSTSIVGMMNDMLMDVVTRGTGREAQIGRPVAGKTGTTSDYKDAWFLGFTPNLVTGVWVGNDDNEPMKKVTGGMLPARIWHDFMQPALAREPVMAIPVETAPTLLPWDRQAEMPRQPQGQRQQNVELGRGFWDKLLGPEVSKNPEFEYPQR